MASIISAATKASIEGFVGAPSSDHRRNAYVEFAAVFISYIVAVVLLALFGKFLWNYAVVDLFSFAKPVRTVWQMIALMFFVALIRP